MLLRTSVFGLLFCLLTLPATAQDAAQEAPEKPAANAKQAEAAAAKIRSAGSYAIGVAIGKSLRRDALLVDLAAMMRGLSDSLTGKVKLKPEAMQNAIGSYQKQAGEVRRERGARFLRENAKKKGVVTTKSGLQYKIIKAGTGNKPKATDEVRVHYRGTLLDGLEFDSSYKRKEPTEFRVGGVIKGWGESLQLMREGAKWKIFVPSALAYGKRGAGSDIGADEVLVFEIELLKVKK